MIWTWLFIMLGMHFCLWTNGFRKNPYNDG